MAERFPIERLRALVVDILAAVGLDSVDSRTTADALVATDAMGVFTHGTKLLAGYVRRLIGGGYKTKGRPRVERQGPAWAVIDGDSALGQVAGAFSVKTAIEKARATGVAYVGLRNSGHIGAAGWFANLAAREGFVAMVAGNDMPSVVAPGAKSPVFGSNPLAYGVPTDGDPILLDMATAAVAGGKVYAAVQRGEPIPATWIVDREGRPTTDGRLYPDHAALQPMAGHKGYGLGLWCEFLAGLLPGGAITWEIGSWIFDPPEKPSLHNAGFVLIDVEAIAGRTAFDRRVRKLIDEIHAVATAEGVDRVLLPGEREWANLRQAQREGIPLPADVIEKLRAAAKMAGVAWRE